VYIISPDLCLKEEASAFVFVFVIAKLPKRISDNTIRIFIVVLSMVKLLY
jgi:hypothetical protein